MNSTLALNNKGMSLSNLNEMTAVQDNSDIQIQQRVPLVRQAPQAAIQIRSKQVALGGRRIDVDPYQLIRVIKRVTQNIGEYKDLEDVYSTIICGALRKARGDLVNILESQFHIHWEVDATTGKSIFYM